MDLFHKFNDDISKRIYTEYLRCVMQDDFYRGEHDLSIKKYIDDSVFKWDNNESILNCGTGLGDTIYRIVYNKKYFTKIYGFESDENTYNLCEKNINLLSEEYKNKVELYNICLTSSYNINEVLKNRNLTIIGLDTEGNELEVLVCLKDSVKNNSPILALSAYHKVDDLLTFIDFIEDLSWIINITYVNMFPQVPYTTKMS